MKRTSPEDRAAIEKLTSQGKTPKEIFSALDGRVKEATINYIRKNVNGHGGVEGRARKNGRRKAAEPQAPASSGVARAIEALKEEMNRLSAQRDKIAEAIKGLEVAFAARDDDYTLPDSLR